MVVVWTAISYLPAGSVPKGIPRRLFSPNPWSPGAYENWTVIKVRDSGKLYIYMPFSLIYLFLYNTYS